MQFTGDTPATWDMLALRGAASPPTRPRPGSPTSATTSAASTATTWPTTCTRAGCSSAPSSRSTGCTPTTATGCRGTTARPRDASAERFLRLREALVPYTYTLARQANTTGVPIVRPLYLDYPAQQRGLHATGEYLYGDNVLVAPITTPERRQRQRLASARGSRRAPGPTTSPAPRYTGPATVTITDPLVADAGADQERRHHADPHRLRRTTPAPAPLTQLTRQRRGRRRRLVLALPGRRRGQRLPERPVDHDADLLERRLPHADHRRRHRHLHRRRDRARVHAAAVERGRPDRRLRRRRAGAGDRVVLQPERAHRHRHHRARCRSARAHTIALTGSATANPTAGEVIGDGGLCLDVRGGTSRRRHRRCSSTPATTRAAQQVALHRRRHRCRSSASASTPPTAAPPTARSSSSTTCNGTGAQTWTAQANGELINPASGRCLDVPSGNTTPGAVQLQLYDCNGAAAQIWKLPPGPITGPGGAVRRRGQRRPGLRRPPSSCTAATAPTRSAGRRPATARSACFGKCLDVRNGGTANGTPVQLFDCNGSGSQTWATQAERHAAQPAVRPLPRRPGQQREGRRPARRSTTATAPPHSSSVSAAEPGNTQRAAA